jgi:DNA-binding MurR/RpiR family transcriptional regulator
MKIYTRPQPTEALVSALRPHAASVSAASLTHRLREQLPQMRGANATIARQILDDPAAITQCAIGELARLTGTSPASITRFCAGLGLSGYPELKLLIAAALGQASAVGWDKDLAGTIGEGDSAERVTGLIAAQSVRALQQAASTLEPASLARAAACIASASRIVVFGVGDSNLVAREAQVRLYRIGRPAWVFDGLHEAKAGAALCGPGDVLLAISRSGRTGEIIEAAQEARSNGATAIALTSFAASPLAAAVDIVLATPVPDIGSGHGSIAAKYAQLLVIDCLYSLVAQHGLTQAADALARTTTALAVHRAVPNPTKRSKPKPT